ncbi:hypothetical protein L873DRAFT_1616652, partial [Choiromyces venosus 120613-1]
DEILDFLYLLKELSIPPHELHLKKDSLCSIIQNLSVKDGLVKNTRVIIHELHDNFVQVKLISTAS